jgi:hypothetical protein
VYMFIVYKCDIEFSVSFNVLQNVCLILSTGRQDACQSNKSSWHQELGQNCKRAERPDWQAVSRTVQLSSFAYFITISIGLW